MSPSISLGSWTVFVLTVLAISSASAFVTSPVYQPSWSRIAWKHSAQRVPALTRQERHTALKMIRKVDDTETTRKSYISVALDTAITLGGILALSRLAAVFFAKLAEAGSSGPIWPQEQWNQLVRSGELSEEGYRVLHDGGTEPPFSSDLNNEKRNGTYVCAACKTPLFVANTKFDSGSGWPSFFAATDGVLREEDNAVDKFVNMRSEVRCSTCGGHLGHVFGDGVIWRVPTGERYCVNGAALEFRPTASQRVGGERTAEDSPTSAQDGAGGPSGEEAAPKPTDA